MAEPADRMSTDRSGSTQTERPIRASDADRHAAVVALQDAMTSGQLTPDEGSDRIAAAYAAVHVRELGPLTADLSPTPAGRGGPPGWRVLLMMAVEQLRLSFRHADTGRLRRDRIAIALLMTVLLLLTVGFVATQVFDGGPPSGPAAFGRR